MPTIKQNREAGYKAIEEGKLVPANPPLDPKPIPVATYPPQPNPYMRTPLPESYVQQPDSQRQWQSGAVPQVRIPPAAKISNPNTGAQAASQTIVVVQAGAGGGSGSATGGGGGGGGTGSGTGNSITLETNNQKNNSQSVLNLIQGQNITLSADAQGGVTVSSAAIGTVTNTSGNLAANQIVIGNGAADEKTLGTLGTTNTVLHGNAAGPPSFGAVDLTAEVTNNLPVTNLNSGTGANNTTFWRGDGVWSTPPGSATQAIQLITTNNVPSIAINNSNTSLSSIAITFPNSGGPFRVFISYSLYLHFTQNQQNVDFWVSDGTHVMAGVQTGTSNAANGGDTSAAYGGFSTASYSNGTSVTFDLLGIQSGVGPSGSSVRGFPNFGLGPASTFQITVLTSAV